MTQNIINTVINININTVMKSILNFALLLTNQLLITKCDVIYVF